MLLQHLRVPFYELITGTACAILLTFPSASNACDPQDFFESQLITPVHGAHIDSVLNVYPNLRYDPVEEVLINSNGEQFSPSGPSGRSGAALLEAAGFTDQFHYVYPLNADETHRMVPWFDPGRVRDEEFFRFLYFENEASARASLVEVVSPAHDAKFAVTTKNGVACQLLAALEDIGADHPTVFDNVGGSFSWRVIAGTNRLSNHSFGAAIDLNAELGGYWRWAGRPAGDVGPYQNRIPQAVVESFERRGFIWGGKWHHYDGMHFEYRPELIIYARLMQSEK